MSDSFPSLPSEIEYMLAQGIGRLLLLKYRPEFGDQSSFLSAAILNFALLMPPGNERAKRFCDENRRLIEHEANSVHLDPKLADAFSLLYSFALIRLGSTDPDRLIKLTERATEMRIPLRTPEEVPPTPDALGFLAYVRQYALDLLST